MSIQDRQGNYQKYNSDGSTPTTIVGSLANTIQTHNAVSVPASSYSSSPFIDLLGYKEIGITMLNDAVATCSADLYWSNDGVNIHGWEASVISSTSVRYRQTNSVIKARYGRLTVINEDAGAAHTMSSWFYAKP